MEKKWLRKNRFGFILILMIKITILLWLILLIGCTQSSSTDHDTIHATRYFANADFSFAVYGETAHAQKIHKKIIPQIAFQKPDIIVHSGNLVENPASESHWEAFFRILTPVSGVISRYYIVPGKLETEHPEEIRHRFAHLSVFMKEKTYYSFIFKNALFMVLNPYLKQDELYRQQWFIIDTMKKFVLRSNGPVFVFSHKPIYSTGPSGVEQFLLRNWLILLEHFRATLLFSGQDKLYGRYKTSSSTSTVCLVSRLTSEEGDRCNQPTNEFEQFYCRKGSSYLLVGIRNNTVGVKAFDEEGRVIDSFEVSVPSRYHTRAGIEGVYERF